jgi:hypothetical protein
LVRLVSSTSIVRFLNFSLIMSRRFALVLQPGV